MKGLMKRLMKSVYTSNKANSMLIPKEVIDRMGRQFIFDIYENCVVIYPTKDLGKLEIEIK